MTFPFLAFLEFGQKEWLSRWIQYLLICLCLLPCPPCLSDTIYTNLGPGETYNAGTAVFVTDTGAPPFFYQAEARLFTSPGDYNVTQIDIALVYIQGTNSATVSLRTDDLGMPGTVLTSWDLSGLPSFSGISGTTAITGAQVISGISDLTLSAGQSYFLEADPGRADSQMGWFGIPPVNSVTFTASSPGGPWFVEGLYDLAFSVNGDPVATPEPSTIMIDLAGLAALGIIRLVRDRANRRDATRM